MKHPAIFSLIFLVTLLGCKPKHISNGNGKGDSLAERLAAQQKSRFDDAFFEANKQLMIGNTDEAIKQLKQCVGFDASNGSVYYLLAKAFVIKKDNKQALFYIEKANKLEPKNIWYLIELANIYKMGGQYLLAGKVYEQLIGLQPEKWTHYMDAAEQYVYAGKPENALLMLEKLEKKVGLTEEVSLKKEALYLQLGKREKAREEIQKLISKYPENNKYKGMLAELLMAEGQTEKAFAIYKEITTTDPQNGHAQLALANYYRQKSDIETAFSYLKEAFRSRQLDIKLKLQVLVSYMPLVKADQRMKEQAFQLADILVEVHPDDDAGHAIYGDLLYQDKQYKQAREQYLIALENNWKNFNLWQQLVFCDTELKDFNAAIAHADEALELFPGQTLLYYFKATAALQLKDYYTAASMSKAGLDLGTDNKNLLVQLLSISGDANNGLGKYKESDEAFELALQADATNAVILNNWAFYLAVRNEKLDKALIMAEQANRFQPNNPSNMDTYGWVYYKLKRYDQAAEWLQKALAADNSNPNINEHYGDVCYRQGRVDEAQEYWKKAKQLGSTSKDLEKKINEKKIID